MLKYHAMKTNVSVVEELYVILTLTVDGYQRSAARPDRLTRQERARSAPGQKVCGSQKMAYGKPLALAWN
jgi:hypothetical protein